MVPDAVPTDPKDNHVNACAEQAGADLIVTGNRHLLHQDNYQGISVLTPARFLTELLQRDSENPGSKP